MARSLMADIAGSAAPSYHVVTSEGVIPLDATVAAAYGPGMACLVAQEVDGARQERAPDRVLHALTGLGFGWEPRSAPGHMRYVGSAAVMLEHAKAYARRATMAAFRALDIPVVPLDGVRLIDPLVPPMPDYLAMTSTDARLYGGTPCQVTDGERTYALRQTSCVQKFSLCADLGLRSAALPFALFEVSDSFRAEPQESLQLCYRLRRFHLPESHVHVKDMPVAVECSLNLHERIIAVLSGLNAEFVLLINATHAFAATHRHYLRQLASRAGTPALLAVAPPGRMCQDGVEIDVEYKVVDSVGCCRELCTFQIDQDMTQAFRVRCDDGAAPTTIHAVLSGSVERYLYLAIDQAMSNQARGVLGHLPPWISPVMVRVVATDIAALDQTLTVAKRLAAAGISTQVDDRRRGLDLAIADAAAQFVPYLLAVDRTRVQMRDPVSGVFREHSVDELIAAILRQVDPHGLADVSVLSHQPFTHAEEPS